MKVQAGLRTKSFSSWLATTHRPPQSPCGLLTDRVAFSSETEVIVSIPNHRSQSCYYTLAISVG